MSQQGGRPTGREDDWWGQLYDDSTGDTGPTAAADSLDDRFASAAGALGRTPGNGTAREGGTSPGDRTEDGAGGRTGSGGGGADEGRAGDPTAGWSQDRFPPGERDRPPAPGATVPAPRTSHPAPRPPRFPEAGPDAEKADEAPGDRPAHDVPATTDPSPDWWRRAPSEPPPPTSPAPASHPPYPPEARSPEPGQPAPVPEPVRKPESDPDPDPLGAVHTGTAPRTETGPPAGTPARTVPGPDVPAPDPPAPDPPPQDATAEAVAGPAGTGASGSGDTAPDTSSALAADSPALLPPPSVVPPAPAVRPTVPEPPETPGPGAVPAPTVAFVGSRPPTYDAEPTALPAADPEEFDDPVPDTVLDGARYGTWTLRAVSLRGDSARYRGEPRRDALLTARFGGGAQALVLVAMATGARTAPGAHRAAAEACRWIARAVGRSHARLAEDIRAARRGELRSGLHRLTDRGLGRLRAAAAEQGAGPEEYAATLRCLLLPADPECRTRVFFGVGPGGLFRLRDGEWQDIEPQVPERAGAPGPSVPAETPEGDRLTMDLGVTTAPGPHAGHPDPYARAAEPSREPFRFRACPARPGDTLLMCTGGLADPLRGEDGLRAHLARRWSAPAPPGLAAFLADAQARVKGYADGRTAAAVWEA